LGEGKSTQEEGLFIPPHPNLLPEGEGANTLKSTVLGWAEGVQKSAIYDRLQHTITHFGQIAQSNVEKVFD
jgi:hypothetical protein